MLTLAFKNLKSKIGKTIGIVVMIAISIAILFCVFSFNGAVTDYLFANEKVECGESDITITPRSDSSNIMSTENLKNLKNSKNVEIVEWAVGALKLYGTYKNEYLSLFGLDEDNFEKLNSIKFEEGSFKNFKCATDNILISKKMAKRLNLHIDDEIEIEVLNKSKKFYIAGICSDSGYFLSENKVVGHLAGGISRLSPLLSSGRIYNEIYIKVKSGQNVNEVIKYIENKIPSFTNMTIKESVDILKVNQNAKSYSASIIIAGVAVILLALGAVAVAFLLSTEEKRVLISKLTSIGATKKQMFGLFSLEILIIGLIGFLLGMALSPLILLLLLKTTLSSTIMFSVSGGFMVLSGVIVLLVAYLCGLIPYFIAISKSSRENLLQINYNKKAMGIFVLVLLAFILICSIVMFIGGSRPVKGISALINVVLIPLAVCFSSPYVLTLLGKALTHSKNSNVYVTGKSVSTNEGVKRSVRLLSLGFAVSILLTMSWAITKSVFTGFKDDYSNLIFVGNISENEADFNLVKDYAISQDSKSKASKALWLEGESYIGGENRSLNLIGCDSVLDIIEFRYITPKEEIEKKLNFGHTKDNIPYCFIDKAYCELFNLKKGDKIEVKHENKVKTFEVGGVLRQELFGGAYLVMDRDEMSKAFSLPTFDKIVVVSDNAKIISKKMQEKFSEKNFFTLTALDTFTLESKSFDNIFDMIGAFAIIFIIAMLVAVAVNVFIARGARRNQRSQLLLMGMEKKNLLLSEFFEHFLVAAVSLILSLAFSVLHIASLIFALLLFNLYFEFYYVVWVAFTVGLAIAILYMLMPFMFAFKKGYKIKSVKE